MRRTAFSTWAKMRSDRSALLLDTHVWIWFNEGLPELSDQQRQSIDDAARRGEAWVSIISV
jgi:PIN domain nuclease of toxin-antitoxin system